MAVLTVVNTASYNAVAIVAVTGIILARTEQMTLTIHLPVDIETRLRDAASQAGSDPADFAAGLVADGLRAEDDPEAVAAITAAVAEYESTRAAGDRGIPADEVLADIRTTITNGGDHDF
jgi:hypothetical protein